MAIREFATSMYFPKIKYYGLSNLANIIITQVSIMMHNMKRKHQEFKWCKYLLLKYGVTLDIFLHIKPFLFTPYIPVIYTTYDLPRYRPYLHLVSRLYCLDSIQSHNNYMLEQAKQYDSHGKLSCLMIRLFMTDIEEYLDTTYITNIVNNWV